MREAIKRMIDRGFSAEQGQVLTLTIILLALGTLMIIPLLDYMSAGVKTTSQVYEKKTDELAAADAGITDAEWQITYDNITTFTNPVAYSPYDYNTSWAYSLPEQVNAKDTSVTINNVWIPKNINKPDKTLAETIIKTGKLMVTGSVSGASTYQIKITYFKEGTDAPLEVQTIGVWLPPGFSYVDGSSNLESDPSAPYYPSSVSVDPWDSGQAVIWTFESGTLFAGSQGTFPIPPFPGIDITELPMTAIINFGYISQKGGAPNPVSWITTEGVNDIPFSWEAENRFYHISSVAGGTQIDSYTAKSELRQMQSAIAGDYYATGNSNLSSVGSSKNRTKWNDPSSAEVTTANIPPDANVAAAYLYWTGWKNDNSITAVSPLNPDKCNDFSNWTAGSGWDYTSSAGRFTGHNYGIGADLTLKNSLNLSAYSSGLATLTWDQSTNGSLTADDGLDFAFSTDGGSNWSGNIIAFRGPSTPPGSFSYNIPPQYLISGNFKVRFSLVGFSNSGQYCYLDNIKISGMTPDPSVVFRIDNGSGAEQVYLDAGDDGIVGTSDDRCHQGTQDLSASKSQVVRNFEGGDPHGYSYSSFRDVTQLVRKYSQAPTAPATNWPGYATYWVGGIYADASPADQIAYACWSLIIIYSSPQTTGHQLYLYDKFINSGNNQQHGINVDFDGDGQPGGTVSGFLVPKRITGVAGITVDDGGSGYSSPPIVEITGGGGTGATAIASIANGKVVGITVTNGGKNYTSPPTVKLEGDGSGADATALLDDNAGKITTFVGEGDVWYNNDYLALNGTKLWDGVVCNDNSETNPDNVFNTTSMGLGTNNGIDIDTLGIDPPNGQYITWSSDLLKPGDTSAQIDMITHTDVWNLVYIIISFRSEVSTGGNLSFLIH